MAEALRRTDIPGWGADLDPALRPGSQKERFPEQGTGAHWHEPDAQPRRVKVFHSVERPEVTHVFGTSAPPSGLSGQIREVAYRYGEGKKRRWMLLLLADRVNAIEGVAQDLSKGHIPNVFSEMGLRTEFTHNRDATVRKIAVGASVVGAMAIAFMVRRRR